MRAEKPAAIPYIIRVRVREFLRTCLRDNFTTRDEKGVFAIMEYKIISGRTEEIRRVWMPTTRGGQRIRRGTRAKKSSIRKILRNEINAVKSLARTLNCNFGTGDVWLTLSFGEGEISWEDAKAHGIDDDQAMTYAAAVGAIELATEAFSSGLGKVGGKKIGTGGVTDDFVEALAKRASSDPNVQNAIIYAGGVVGEGFEEWLSEWGDYAANRLLVGYDDRTVKDVWGDSKESFMQGAMMSSLLNITQLMQRGVPPKEAIRQGVDETAAEAGISPAEQVSPAAQTMARAATQNAVQETAPAQTDISPAARTMADVLTGKNADAETALPSAEYSAVTENVAARKASDISSRAKASIQQIRQFVRNALSQNNDFQYIKIDDVSPELASLLNANGIHADGYSHVFKDNDIRHIENRHGEKSGAKYPVTEATLSKTASAIENYDVLYQGYDTKSGNPAVVYEYRDGNRTFYVEEVLEDGVLSSKQAVIVGGTSKPSFLKKYKKIADKVSDTDVAAQGRATGQSPLGNHVQDADTNVSNLEASASNSIILAQSQNVNPEGVETRLSQTAETVRDAAVTPDAVKQSINENIENGGYRYIPESNADAVASARAGIRESGYASVLRSWTADARGAAPGAGSGGLCERDEPRLLEPRRELRQGGGKVPGQPGTASQRTER